MAAKQSAEMRAALALVAQGLNITRAAAQAGVHRLSLGRVLKKISEKSVGQALK